MAAMRFEHRMSSTAEHLRMSMPINVRNATTDDLVGNQFAPARCAVPLGTADPGARMRAVRDLVARQRAEPARALTEPLASVLGRLPATLSTAVVGAMLRGIDVVTSNVPGVPVPVYLAGARLDARFPFGPMTGAATNGTLLSDLDEAHIGVNRDPVAVPDGEAFLECLQEGFDEMLQSA